MSLEMGHYLYFYSLNSHVCMISLPRYWCDKLKMKYLVTLGMCLWGVSSFGKPYMPLSLKNLAKQPAENRINYFMTSYYDWQKSKDDFKRIDSLEQIAKELSDNQLKEYAISARYILKYVLEPDSLKKETVLKEANSFFANASNGDLKAFCYYNIGMRYFFEGKIKKCLPFIFEAKLLLENLNYTSFRHASYYYDGFFSLYYYFQDYRKAIQFQEMGLKNPHNILYFPADYHDNIGLCYVRLKEYDKAEVEFKKSIAFAKKSKDIAIEGVATGNLGLTYWLKGEYKKSLPPLYYDLKVNEKSLPLNVANGRLYIAYSLLKLDSVEKASTYFPSYRTHEHFWSRGYNRLRYMTYSLYYDKINKHKLASVYKDSLLALNDSIKIATDITKIAAFESRLEAEKFLNEKKELEANAKYEKMLRNVIIFGLFVVFGIGIVWLNERRKQTQRLEKLKRQQAEEKLAQTNQQLNQYIINIREKNELIDKITSQIRDKENLLEEEPNGIEATLRSLQQSVLLTEKDWIDFKEIFEQVFPHFFKNLDRKYPDLTAGEVRLAALEKLNLTDKIKGNMLGISADSVKKTRYRLRKKYPTLIEGSATPQDVLS